MNNDTQKQIKELQRQVKELMEWKKERESQQLTLPIDYASMKALDNAFREYHFQRINVKEVILQPVTNIIRNVKGRICYYDDLGTQNFLMTTTVNPPDGADFTGRVDLTAV